MITTTTFETPPAANPAVGTPLRVGLWIAQVVAAAVFCFAGYTKLTTPIPQLSSMMPWAGQVPETFVRFIALVDLAGGIGLLLPALTRVMPRLTLLAALGCIVLQILASGFHIARGEVIVLPLNAVLLALSLFIFWGRSRKVPISPRH